MSKTSQPSKILSLFHFSIFVDLPVSRLDAFLPSFPPSLPPSLVFSNRMAHPLRQRMSPFVELFVNPPVAATHTTRTHLPSASHGPQDMNCFSSQL